MTVASANAYRQVEKDLVVVHGPLVKRIALHLMARLPDSVQLDDLIQAGMIGLIEASRQFDASRGASFSTYAGIRIRGAMLDELRRLDWTPRSVHRKAREVGRVIQEIEHQTGRSAQDREVIEALGISQHEYDQILQDASVSRVLSVDQDDGEGGDSRWDIAGEDDEPADMLEQADFKRALADAIRALPEREQLIMSLYYEEELNLREIGAVIGVSESRISQIHGRIALKLRAQVADWIN